MSFPRYPKYKASLPAEALAKAGGVEWLGAVPGWRANGPASNQPRATPWVMPAPGASPERAAQPCAAGSPLQGLHRFFTTTQGVALGWHESRPWRCGGGT